MIAVDETTARRIGRRSLTIPAYLAALALMVIVGPILLPAAVLYDLAGRRRFAATRLLVFALIYLLAETVGIGVSLLLTPLWWASPTLSDRYHRALQSAWARTLFWGAQRCFGLRLEVEGADSVPDGPMIALCRHVSLADTLLPAVLLAHRIGIRLRWVLKRELLWDPCLDLVGQRLPNVFVQRASADSLREIGRVRALPANLSVGEGILIYPEGTRFTPAKRQRVLQRMESQDPERHARVACLTDVLPIQLGGPTALLEACPQADLVLLAHTGLEGATTLGDIWHGAIIDRTINVRFWSIPAAAIPRSATERGRWLDEEWARLDTWVKTRQHGTRSEGVKNATAA